MNPVSSLLITAFAALAMQQGAATARTTATASPPTDVVNTATRRFVPFGVGEKMDYQVKFGFASVGKGSMEVKGIEAIRGRPTWNVEMRIEGGVPLLYSVETVMSSWLDTTSLFSLRYTQDGEERGKKRIRYYDIFPERSMFKQRIMPDTLPEMPSVAEPLDDASFMYFIRTTPLEVGQTYSYDRYFRPDRNPVIVKVLGKEVVSVPAGEFPAIVIQPTIKTNKMFENGKAKIWLSDDPFRMVLKIESEVAAIGSLHLNMTNYRPPRQPRR